MKTAVFVPSYCLTRDKTRLTVMNREVTLKAGEIAQYEQAEIILSNAYECWRAEINLRVAILHRIGISLGRIISFGPVTNSYEEIEKVRGIVRRHGFQKIIIVAEKWHSKRVLMTFKALFSDLELDLRPVKVSKFEFTYEPSLIKSLRTGSEWSWALWNKLFELLTLLVLKRVQ